MNTALTEDERNEIASLIGGFDDQLWESFIRKELGLDDDALFEIKGSWRKHLISYKMDVIKAWMENQGSDATRRLAKLMKDATGEAERRNTESTHPTYPSSQGKGCALIIANSFVNFSSKIQLSAAEADAKMMKELWIDTLKCDLFGEEIHMNKTAEQIKHLLRRMSKQKLEYDYVVVVISSHGGVFPENVVKKYEIEDDIITEDDENGGTKRRKKEKATNDANYKNFFESLGDDNVEGKPTVDVFFGGDFVPIRERQIVQYFHNSQKDSALLDIPKFFILDYCRGSKSDTGLQRTNQRNFKEVPYPQTGVEEREEPGEFEAFDSEMASVVPSISDVLIVYAAHRDYVAIMESSSWLISAISRVFKQNFPTTDVIGMLTMVNHEIKGQEISIDFDDKKTVRCKSMSIFESSLVKKFYLVQQ